MEKFINCSGSPELIISDNALLYCRIFDSEGDDII